MAITMAIKVLFSLLPQVLQTSYQSLLPDSHLGRGGKGYYPSVSKGQGEDSAPLSDLALPCMAPHLPALTPWSTFPHQNRMGGRSREQGWSVEASLRAMEP